MKYSELVEYYQQLEETQKTKEKTSILADLYLKAEDDCLEEVVLLSLGRAWASWKDKDMGISSKMMVKIISQATGKPEEEVEKNWKDKGDLGDAAEEMVKNKTQQRLVSENLSIHKIIKRLNKVASMEKEGINQSVDMSKKKREIADLISTSEPIEAKYIVRTVLGTLRLGVAEGIVRDALSEAFFNGENTQEIQKAFDLTNDFTTVAEACRNGFDALNKLGIEIFRPINSMLAKKVDTISEGFETVGKPAAIEFKYDGVRAQIHKKDEEVRIFTRRLEDITKQFPDLVNTVKNNLNSNKCIIDAEIVGYDPDTNDMIPFQKLSKRIKRKYDIQKMKEEIPVLLRPFDLIYHHETFLNKNLEKRWSSLEEIIHEKDNQIKLVDHRILESKEEVAKLQQKSLDQGHEGIMMKNLNENYKPGSRVGYMVKLKPTMETLDLVITGGEWGEGRRSGWIGSIQLSCIDKETGEYKEIGKMATGLTDKQLKEITNRLKPLITNEKGRNVKVKPQVIVEAEYEEIQKSPEYSSGYALRFPRLKQFRDDKESPDSLEKVKNLYEGQK